MQGQNYVDKETNADHSTKDLSIVFAVMVLSCLSSHKNTVSVKKDNQAYFPCLGLLSKLFQDNMKQLDQKDTVNENDLR